MDNKHEHLKWTEVSRIKLLDCKIFSLFESERVAGKGKRGTFNVIKSSDWVTIVPVLKNEEGEDCFLMVRQYRHGSASVTLEFPAGLIDEGETALKAAKRELLEETGYVSNRIKEVGSVNPNPAFMSNTTYTFIAENLEFASEQSLDENEILDFEIWRVEDIRTKIGTQEMSNAIMVQAMFWYDRWKALQ